MLKTCSRCGEIKDLTEFYLDKGKARSRCKECCRKAAVATEARPPLAPDDPRHGTSSGYIYWKCRCDSCKAANYIPSSGVSDVVRPYIKRARKPLATDIVALTREAVRATKEQS